MQIFLIWIVIRIINSLFAIVASPLRRLTDLERSISIWPPSTPIQAWLNRLFLAPFERWDAKWYIKIVSQGYVHLDGAAQFHPLYPATAAIFHQFGISPLASLMLVSTIASLILFFAFHQLARLDLSKEDTVFALLLLAVSPPSFVFFAPYPEGLFLIWTVACFYWSRQQKWWLASLAGALAVLTRQQGLFLIFPLVWEFWEARQRNLRTCLADWKNWLSFSMIPLAMFGWISYRALYLNDLQPKIANLNAFIYSVIISPKANQVVPDQVFLPPWQTLWLASEKLFTAPDADLITNLVGSLLFVAIFILVWPAIRPSYRIYSLVIILVSFSYYTGNTHPTMGLLRHLMLAIPVFIGIPSLFHKPGHRLAFITASAAGMIFLLILYVFEAWVV